MTNDSAESFVRSYADFPKKGILFRDICPILRDPIVFESLIKKMSDDPIFKNAEAILAIDARGFIFGTAIALKTSKPLVIARKPGKLPGELISNEYKLEYGSNSLSIQKDAIQELDNFAIVDDLLATGGTVNCVSNLLQSNGKKVLGLITVVELTKLEGRTKFNFPVESFVSF